MRSDVITAPNWPPIPRVKFSALSIERGGIEGLHLKQSARAYPSLGPPTCASVLSSHSTTSSTCSLPGQHLRQRHSDREDALWHNRRQSVSSLSPGPWAGPIQLFIPFHGKSSNRFHLWSTLVRVGDVGATLFFCRSRGRRAMLRPTGVLGWRALDRLPVARRHLCQRADHVLP